MKRKHFILALVAMLWSFSFSAFAGDVIVVNNEAELRAALAASDVQRTAGLRRAAAQQSADAQSDDAQLITFGRDVTLTAPFETNIGGNYVLDLEGYALRGAAIDGTKHQYPFYNRATLIIKDSKGGGYIDCGVYNGYDTDGVTYSDARLEMVSGKVVCHDEDGAAIINYGTTIISGGSVEGSVNALNNVQGTMTVTDGVIITGEVAGNVTISTGVKFTVAKIGDNVYTTFSEALTAANAMTGDVTMQIFGEVEFTDGMELNGSYTSINFVGKSAKAKMTVNQSAGGDYLEAHGKTVTFTDLTLAKANASWQNNSGHMSAYFSLQGGTATYTNCTFLNGACTSGGTATYTDCTFQNASEYGLWVYDDAAVTVNGGTIDSKKGIKVYSEDEASVTTTLTVQNATFTENVAAKPAVAVGYAESITLIGNTYNNTTGVLELDSGSDADCEGITFVAQDSEGNDISSTITAVDRSNSNAACGVLVDGKIYTTVTEAAKEATETSTVTLLHSSDEVVEFPMGATIETNGYTADNVTTAQPFADYVVLPISMTVNNYKAMFGENTVTDGTNYYATLQTAVEAVAGKANTILYCKPGADVGSLQHAPVTSTLTVYGNNANVTGGDERDFDLGNTDPSGGKDITADMTLTVKHLNGCGAWGAKATDHTVNLVFESCANMGKVFITGTTGTLNITMTDCAFEGVIKDAVYSNADGAITLTNVAFSNLNKAVNLNHKAAGTQTVTIDGCSFTNCGADVTADQIPVRVLSSVAGGKSVLAVNNTTFTGTPEGGADILLAHGAGVTEATVTNTAANVKPGNAEMVAVTVQDSYEYNNIVAKIGNAEYASLQAAIDAVKNGETITLVEDIEGEYTLTEKVGLYYTIDGANKTLKGSIKVTALSDTNDNRRITIKNLNFVDEDDNKSVDFISSVATNYYPRLTIEGCTFTGSGYEDDKDEDVAIRLKSAYGAIIKSCTGTGLHSFLQNTAGVTVTVENVTVSESNGGLALGTAQNVTIKGCNISTDTYGIRLDAVLETGATLENNVVNAYIPVSVRGASAANYDLSFSGDQSSYTATNGDAVWCAICSTEYEPGVELNPATGKVSVTLNDSSLDPTGIYGNFGVASIGNVKYQTLAAALDAAQNDETVTLLWKEGDAPISMAGTVCGNKTVTITGTAEVDWDKDWLYVGRNGEGNGKLIFREANLTSKSVGISNNGIGLNVSCKKEGSTTTNDGEVEIIDSHIQLDYLIGKGNIKLVNSTLNVYEGFAVGARPASETGGQQRTVTMDITSGSEVIVNNHNGQGLGYESKGIMNIDATSTFETTQSFLVTANGTMNIAGKASVAGTLTNNGAINLTDKTATLTTATAGLTVNTDVADYKVAYIDGTYKLVEKDYIAQVGDEKFESFAEALDAVEDGGTIKLLGGAFDESGKEIDFEKVITFTITGEAPEAKLPIVTFQNATVNILNAEFQIPELDARQNATINVNSSTIVDAGGNSIVKSYYNGKINITNNSTVYVMQVTTMGYINIDKTSTLNATWQTNVYGNGMLTVSSGATFNTAALHLTGQDYSGRDNTDAERVGQPATIVVDGANLTIGMVKSYGGSDYSYNSSKGINVGTVDGKNAVLDIKNGANVSIWMANGETANFGAGGTVNVDASTLNVACRATDGTATLANNGTVYVTDASTLNATVAGEGWFYMNGVSLGADTKLLGAKVRFAKGTNTVDGSTIDNGIFQVGIGAFNGVDANVDTENGVIVNVKNNATVGSNGDTYAGWIGTGYYDTDAEKAAAMTDAKYVLNIDNSIAEFGYLHVSNDGELNVNGVPADKAHYNNSDYAFYAGDFIINGTASFNDTDVLALYTKVSCDNGTDMPGTLNINAGTEYEAERHNGAISTDSNFTLYKTGVVNVAEGADLQACEASSIATDAALNIAGSVTALGTVTNNGAINFTSDVATLTTGTSDLAIGYNVDPDKKVVYADGAYKAVSKLYVAKIGDANFESLQEAIENVTDNGTITLLSDVTVTEAAHNGINALNHARAINFTLDLNGKKLSADTGNSVFRFNISDSGATSDVTVTVKNGTVVSGANTWCALMASGISADVKAVMNLEDLTIENYKGGDFAVKAWDNGVVNAKNVTINASYGGGFYALGGEIVLDDCTVEQKGLWTAPYNSMTVGVSNGGKMTVNSGTYSAVPAAVADGNNQGTSHGSWCGGIMSSGGTLIINGGTFSNGNIDGTASNPRELFTVGADADYGDNVAAYLEINGGTFSSIGDFVHCETIWGSANDAANTYMPTMKIAINDGDFTGVAGKVIGGNDPISTGNPVEVVISGGTYSAKDAIDESYLADAYIIVDNGNSTYTVSNGTVKVGDTYHASLEAGLEALTDGATLTLLESITVAELWDCRYNGAKVTAANVTIDGNGKTLKLTGAVDDKNWNTVFRFEGDNATVKNLTIDASEATGIQRGISSKLSLTVDNTTFIGNGTTAKRAIIFGEGAGTSISNVVATVTNSTFMNWSYGVSDNQNTQDAKNVTVTGNTFENASVLVSASDKVVFSNNTLTDGGVNITSYTNVENVSVQAFNNTLDTDEENEITTNPARHMISGEGFSTPVAKMDGKYYVSIQKAVDKSAATGSEITLTVNRYLDMDEAVVIEGKVVTLNLNGKIVRATADAQMTGGIFRLLDGANLTITGEGEINYNGNANVYAAVGILGAANLTVENSKLVGYYYGITGNGMKDGSTITINGGEISSVEGTGSGIYHPQNGTLTVQGGTITGATGIYFKSGILNITDGTVNGTGAKVAYGHNGNGSDATGDALVIENVAAGNYEAVTSVAVTGGSFNSVNADPIASYAADGATALTQFVTGGTFNKTFSEECLPVGYQLMDYDNNGYYNVELTNTRESMTFVDGEFTEYTIATDMNVGTLTYKRASIPTTWTPFYVPFEVPVSQLAEQGFEVAYINGVRRGDKDDDGVLDNFVMEVIYIHGGNADGSSKRLKANYPYFIRTKGSERKDLNIVLEGTTLYAAKNATYDCTTMTELFEITGNNSNMYYSDFATNNYGVAAGSWYPFYEGDVLKPFRFYMTISSRVDSEPVIMTSMSISVRGEEREDGTTFIYDVEMTDKQTADYIYDLQGRRVLEPQKGSIYIVNGKKVIF